MGMRRIVEPRRVRLRARDLDLPPQCSAEPVREIAHGKNFTAGYIDRHSGRAGEVERLDGMSNRVRLPDDVHISGGNIHGTPGENHLCDINQETVTKLD